MGRHASALDRETALGRVIAVTNDKGGVGKTSIVANLGGQLAAANYRVLLVDLNRQANLADDLGIRESPVDDQGDGLISAIVLDGKHQLPVASGVRPNLDVVCGGTRLEALTPLMVSKTMGAGVGSNEPSPFLALADVLVPVAQHYDVVLIDCPPENFILTDLALAAARWVIMPTKTDLGGLVGMRLVAERFAKAKEINPLLGLLGAVLFGTGTKSTAIHTEARDSITKAFGGNSPLFTTMVRHAERTAQDARRLGKLAHELEVEAMSQPAWWELLRRGARAKAGVSMTAASVASDYRELAFEVLTVLRSMEESAAEPAGTQRRNAS
ncbi:ParA family protein [Pseudonocardia spinosispora]|uniref:ParA family protein n=1 Tax=Pseudonocardia spinosispora TaxID=103441 RepID=UPI000403918C|nr:ParA family protein [Pseudonocardia spinosispora]